MTKRYRYTAVVPWPCQQKGLLSHLLGSNHHGAMKATRSCTSKGVMKCHSLPRTLFQSQGEGSGRGKSHHFWMIFPAINGHVEDFLAMFDDTEGYPKAPKQIPQGFPWRRTPGSSFRCRWEIATATGPVDWMRPGLGGGVVGFWYVLVIDLPSGNGIIGVSNQW